MMPPDPSLLAQLLLGKPTFDPDTDRCILESARTVSARGAFELFRRSDTAEDGWEDGFASKLAVLADFQDFLVYDYDDKRWPGIEEVTHPDAQSERAETLASSHRPPQMANSRVFLRVQFRNDDAAYYQFHLFPDYEFGSDEVSLSRLRNGDSQFICLSNASPEERRGFERYLLGNLHVLAVSEISEKEYSSKRSESV